MEETLNAVPMPPQAKSKVAIKVLIPDAVITEHSELLSVYDQQSETLTYDVDNNIPKEFIESLEQLVPQFHGNDIVVFNPLIEKINELQAIKSLTYNADDYEASDRLYIDNNKIIGSINTSIKEVKALMKQPQISKNKLIDKIFDIFENESKNTRGALETNFKPLLDKREEAKNAKEAEKKKAELEAIANLSSTNAELEEKLAAQTKTSAIGTVENALSSILTNVAIKIPSLNKEGLETLRTNVVGIQFNMYVAPETQNLFQLNEITAYQETFKNNRAAAIKNIDLALEALNTQSANVQLANANAVLNAQVPAPGTGMEAINMEMVAPQELSRAGTGTAPFYNNAEIFQMITDESNRIFNEYQKMIERFEGYQFTNLQVAEVRDKLTKENLPKIAEWLGKIKTFCDNKQVLINQHFNK